MTTTMPSYLVQWDTDGSVSSDDRANRLHDALADRGPARLAQVVVVEGAVLATLEAEDDAALGMTLEGLDPAPSRWARVEASIDGSPAPRADKSLPGRGDPLAFALMQWPAVYGLYELPTVWWGHLLRGVLVLWLLATVRATFASSKGALHGYGVGIVLNAVWATLVWRLAPHWSSWACGVLLFVSYLAQVRMITDARARSASPSS